MAQNWVCKVLRYILVLWPMFYAETQEYVLASIVAHISIFFYQNSIVELESRGVVQ